MQTITLTLADDVVAAADRLHRERSISLNDAINELLRAGLANRGEVATRFEQKSHDLGEGIDFNRIADTLDVLQSCGHG